MSQTPPLPVTAAEFAGMDPNDFPDVVVHVTDKAGGTFYDSRGADGARAWVQTTPGVDVVVDHEAEVDPHPGYLTPVEGDAAYSATGHTHGGFDSSFARLFLTMGA